MSRYIVKPLLKAIEVLKCVGQLPEPLSLKDIALRVGMPRTSVFRDLRTFEAAGMIVHDKTRDLYRIDTRIIGMIMNDSEISQQACSRRPRQRIPALKVPPVCPPYRILTRRLQQDDLVFDSTTPQLELERQPRIFSLSACGAVVALHGDESAIPAFVVNQEEHVTFPAGR